MAKSIDGYNHDQHVRSHSSLLTLKNMHKVLFLLKMPPPVHGSTFMNQQVYNSSLIKSSFDCTFFPVSISKDMKDIGKISFRKIRKVLSDYMRLHRVLRETKPSLVYFAVSSSGMALFKDLMFYLIIKQHNVNVLFHHHSKGIKINSNKNFLYRWIYSFMLPKSDNICLAKELVSDLALYANNSAYIVPNGIKEVIDHQVNPSLSSSTTCKILYLSNYIKSKGILEVIDAAEILKKQQVDFSISIVGKPFDISEEELKSYINNLKLNHCVEVLGPKYDDDKYAILRGHDFFVFPTFYKNECLPLVLIEAMQHGLPVISTFEGGIPSLIDDKINGFLIKKHDTEDLAEKMKYLILHPEKRKQMGLKARDKYLSCYTLDKFEYNLVQVIDSVLSRSYQSSNVDYSTI